MTIAMAKSASTCDAHCVPHTLKTAPQRDWPAQRFETFEEAERASVSEELRRTPAERLAAVEVLRRRWHGEDYELAHRLVGPLAVVGEP